VNRALWITVLIAGLAMVVVSLPTRILTGSLQAGTAAGTGAMVFVMLWRMPLWRIPPPQVWSPAKRFWLSLGTAVGSGLVSFALSQLWS
jgi:hypothetical protein